MIIALGKLARFWRLAKSVVTELRRFIRLFPPECLFYY